jgi:Amt family ammonium transporter
MHSIPGLRLRVQDHIERIGIDESDMGEFAYDYVGPQTQSEVRAMSFGQGTGYELRTQELKDRIAPF